MRVPQVDQLFIEVFKMSSHDRTLQPTVKTLVFFYITCLTQDRTDDMKLGSGTVWQIRSTVSQECRSEDLFVCCCKLQCVVSFTARKEECSHGTERAPRYNPTSRPSRNHVALTEHGPNRSSAPPAHSRNTTRKLVFPRGSQRTPVGWCQATRQSNDGKTTAGGTPQNTRH